MEPNGTTAEPVLFYLAFYIAARFIETSNNIQGARNQSDDVLPNERTTTFQILLPAWTELSIGQNSTLMYLRFHPTPYSCKYCIL